MKDRSIAKRVLRSFGNAYVKDPENARQVAASISSAEFVDSHFARAKEVGDRSSLIALSIRLAPLEGLFTEFGVYKGESLRLIAREAEAKGCTEVYGFDSFEGLPERWRDGFSAGSFSLPREPRAPRNAKIVKGRFENTLADFLSTHPQRVAFAHLDADLYTSTAFVLQTLAEHARLREGTVLQFDEFFNYPGWQTGGEFKAFSEFTARWNVNCEFVGYVRGGEQVSLRIIV